MAPRAHWKGYLKLSLVSCPIALYPATSEREKISFHELNKETDNRIRYRKVDAETGDEPQRQMSMRRLSRDEAFLIPVNIAKLPSVPRQILKDIPRPPNSAS